MLRDMAGRLQVSAWDLASLMEWFFFSVVMGDVRGVFCMVSGIQTTEGFLDDGTCIKVSRSYNSA